MTTRHLLIQATATETFAEMFPSWCATFRQCDNFVWRYLAVVLNAWPHVFAVTSLRRRINLDWHRTNAMKNNYGFYIG